MLCNTPQYTYLGERSTSKKRRDEKENRGTQHSAERTPRTSFLNKRSYKGRYDKNKLTIKLSRLAITHKCIYVVIIIFIIMIIFVLDNVE